MVQERQCVEHDGQEARPLDNTVGRIRTRMHANCVHEVIRHRNHSEDTGGFGPAEEMFGDGMNQGQTSTSSRI